MSWICELRDRQVVAFCGSFLTFVAIWSVMTARILRRTEGGIDDGWRPGIGRTRPENQRAAFGADRRRPRAHVRRHRHQPRQVALGTVPGPDPAQAGSAGGLTEITGGRYFGTGLLCPTMGAGARGGSGG